MLGSVLGCHDPTLKLASRPSVSLLTYEAHNDNMVLDYMLYRTLIYVGDPKPTVVMAYVPLCNEGVISSSFMVI